MASVASSTYVVYINPLPFIITSAVNVHVGQLCLCASFQLFTAYVIISWSYTSSKPLNLGYLAQNL